MADHEDDQTPNISDVECDEDDDVNTSAVAAHPDLGVNAGATGSHPQDVIPELYQKFMEEQGVRKTIANVFRCPILAQYKSMGTFYISPFNYF